MAVRVLPDAERIVAAYLRAHLDVAAAAGTHVGTALPDGEAPVWPWITVVRVGGVPSLAGYLDAPRVEITVWASTKGGAQGLARIIEAAMDEIPGAHPLGVVTEVDQTGVGLRWNPDEVTDTPRYQMIYDLYVHPPVAP